MFRIRLLGYQGIRLFLPVNNCLAPIRYREYLLLHLLACHFFFQSLYLTCTEHHRHRFLCNEPQSRYPHILVISFVRIYVVPLPLPMFAAYVCFISTFSIDKTPANTVCMVNKSFCLMYSSLHI